MFSNTLTKRFLFSSLISFFSMYCMLPVSVWLLYFRWTAEYESTIYLLILPSMLRLQVNSLSKDPQPVLLALLGRHLNVTKWVFPQWVLGLPRVLILMGYVWNTRHPSQMTNLLLLVTAQLMLRGELWNIVRLAGSFTPQVNKTPKYFKQDLVPKLERTILPCWNWFQEMSRRQNF